MIIYGYTYFSGILYVYVYMVYVDNIHMCVCVSLLVCAAWSWNRRHADPAPGPERLLHLGAVVLLPRLLLIPGSGEPMGLGFRISGIGFRI